MSPNVSGRVTRLVNALLFLVVFAISLVVPRDDSLWVFTCNSGGGRFADSSKYLYLYCQRQTDIQPVWVSESEAVVEELTANGCPAYTRQSRQGRLALLRAKVVCSTHTPTFEKFLGGATVVDLRHGNSLKLMGRDEGEEPRDFIRVLKRRVWDPRYRAAYVLVTNDGKPYDVVASARGLTRADVLVAPYPRLDVLLGEVDHAELGTSRAALASVVEETVEETVILYAPTWRRSLGHENGAPLPEAQPAFERVDDLLAEYDCRLYVAPHPADPPTLDYDDHANIERLKTGGDIYPFLKHIDVLVTDYSSLFYDYTVLDRPMVFYAADLEEYERSRGLYFDYEDHVPGPVARSTDELCEALVTVLEGDDGFGQQRAEMRSEYYGSLDRRPSEEVYWAIERQIGTTTEEPSQQEVTQRAP